MNHFYNEIHCFIDCPEEIPSFKCNKGFFISGRIEPPLKGVTINITGIENEESMIVLTDDRGQYKAGPLIETANYTVVSKGLNFLVSTSCD